MIQTDFGHDRRTRKKILLDEMEQVKLWPELPALIAPHVSMTKTGGQPVDLAIMLPIQCLQQWFDLSDLGAEESLFKTSFNRDFVGISGTQRIPESVSILGFSHKLEEFDLSPNILQVTYDNLSARGKMLKIDTVVDAPLAAVPRLTQNNTVVRAPPYAPGREGQTI